MDTIVPYLGKQNVREFCYNVSLVNLKLITRYRVTSATGYENCKTSVNNGKHRVGFQPRDYFGLHFLGFYLTKMLRFWDLSSR